MKWSEISDIPDEPGCYQFLNNEGRIIYIGKAKNLRKRVRSYFSKTKKDIKTEFLVKKIKDVRFIATNNESEAFLLESNLIKKYKPRYNIDLKDSKRYAYIILTKEKFPRLLIARRRDKKGEYIGPFVSAEARDRIIKVARMIFHIRTCRKLPKKACLRYHIGLCDAPCIGNISEDGYNVNIADSRDFLKGKTKELEERLEKEMKKYSDDQRYEHARVLRDRIYALKALKERQQAERVTSFDQDIIAYLQKKDKALFFVFNVKKGILMNKQEFEFDTVPEELSQFISRFYEDNPVPREVITEDKINEETLYYLERKSNDTVKITIPKRGGKRSLLDLAKKNILLKENRNEIALESLRKPLKLPDIPKVIECFDISHIQGKDTVASMVRFTNGEPDKANYRRFKIRTVTDVNDFASIAEVVRRRYKRLLSENMPLPDLIVIDGGKGQLSSAVSEIRALGLNIPTISLAKKHEEVFVPHLKFPIEIKKDSEGSLLLQHIRDEAHRFAVTYHRTLRKKHIKK